MYIIKRNGKRVGKKFFLTYEQARNHARKLIRKNAERDWTWFTDHSDTVYHNPSLRVYGYKIVNAL